MERDEGPGLADRAEPASWEGVRIRLARPEDNAALVALAAACPMRAAMSLCVHRAPDFFALSRLQGSPWYLFVAEDRDAGVIGCVAGAVRQIWHNGEQRSIMFAGDFKLRPDFRGQGLADRLLVAGYELCVEKELALLMGALAGNRPIERRVLRPPDGTPQPVVLGTIGVHTLLLPGLPIARPPRGIAVAPAREDDVDAMLDLWSRTAPQRECAPVLDRETLLGFVADAPGLSISDYLVARRGDEIAGWFGVWSQDAFKETRVLDFSAGLALARRAHNAVARPLGWPLLPARDQRLRALQVLHLCVPATAPEVLRSLLFAARRRCVQEGVPALEIGLDPRDPLMRALRRFPRVTVDVRCYITPPPGQLDAPRPARQPIHFETALV